MYEIDRDQAAADAAARQRSAMPEILRMSDRIVVMCEGRITGRSHAGGGDARSASCNWRRNAKQWRLKAMDNQGMAAQSEHAAAEVQAPAGGVRPTASSGTRRGRSCSRSRA